MIERMQALPAGVLGLTARGKVTEQDYTEILEPLFEEARRAGQRVRLCFHFGPEFEGFTAGAMWEDMKVGLRYLRLFDRCAVVSDEAWIRNSSCAVGAVLPMTVRSFPNDELGQALAWLSEPAEAPAVTHRLLADRGVLVVEPHRSLSAADFDAIAAVIDPLIEAEGSLRGLVVHAKAFPGWESLSGFLQHIRFVRDHHRKIARVAVAADGKVAELGPALAKHFVSAEIERFPYADLERAVAWASGAAHEAARV